MYELKAEYKRQKPVAAAVQVKDEKMVHVKEEKMEVESESESEEDDFEEF